ncbi:MAG: hypothetical protein EZS28_036850, partial [Streblomastix strix]
RSYVACNSTVSRIGTNVSPRMSGLRKSVSRPILRNRNGIWTTIITINILFTNTDRLVVLHRSAITAIVIITTVSRIWNEHESKILKFKTIKHHLLALQFYEIQSVAIWTAFHKRTIVSVHIESNLIARLFFQFEVILAN